MAPSEQRELENLSTRLSRLEHDFAEQSKMIVEMRDILLSARSSWKTGIAIAGLAATVGGLIAKFIPVVFK